VNIRVIALPSSSKCCSAFIYIELPTEKNLFIAVEFLLGLVPKRANVALLAPLATYLFGQGG
jgi:hypothetical protein